MSELEAIVASMRDQGLPLSKINSVIEEYDKEDKTNSFVPDLSYDSIATESTSVNDTVVIPTVDKSEENNTEDPFEELEKDNKKELKKYNL